MKNGDILKLQDNLSAVQGVSGTIVEKDNSKYLKVEAKTQDSGGEYVLTQYVTVKDGKKHTLSFYTASDESRDYIENIFNSQFKGKNTLETVAILGICVFVGVAIVVTVLIIKDIKKRNVNAE